MKNKILICLSLFAVVSLSGCLKKGDDDPFISLRSRKARVAGDWKVVSMTKTEKYTTSGTPSSSYTIETTFDGSTYKEVTTMNNVKTTDSASQTVAWTFDKEGKYSMTEVTDAMETKTTGHWDFTSGVGETKNKTQLTISEETRTDVNGESTYTGNTIDEIYDINELRNKAMVLSYHRTLTDANGTADIEYKAELEAK